MNRRALLGFALLLGLSAGCSAVPRPAPAGWYFPRHEGFQNGGPAALGIGTLVARQGCLYIDGEGPDTLVIWPRDFWLEVSGGIAIVQSGGGTSVRLGEEVRMGGGYYEDLPAVLPFVRELLLDPDLPPCPTRSYFVGTGFAGG